MFQNQPATPRYSRIILDTPTISKSCESESNRARNRTNTSPNLKTGILGSFWGRSGAFWGRSGAFWGSFWSILVSFRSVLGSCWGCSGVVLVHSGVVQGSIQGRFLGRSGVARVRQRPKTCFSWALRSQIARAEIKIARATRKSRAQKSKLRAQHANRARNIKIVRAHARDVPALGAQDACRASGPVSGPTVRGAKPSPRAERLRKRTPAAPFFIIL
jgi:hypothetical protein